MYMYHLADVTASRHNIWYKTLEVNIAFCETRFVETLASKDCHFHENNRTRQNVNIRSRYCYTQCFTILRGGIQYEHVIEKVYCFFKPYCDYIQSKQRVETIRMNVNITRLA